MRLAAAVTAVSALGAACLQIPDYRGPTKVGYSLDDKTKETTVTTPLATLHFPGSGFQFPDQLQISNVDVMGHVTSPCWGESGTGFAVMPMPRVSGDPLDGGVVVDQSNLNATMTGPAVVQLQLTWSTHWNFAAGLNCSTSSDHKPGGTSTFTVFPDGHIVRHDVLTDPNPANDQITTGRCTCGPMPLAPDLFILSSYWAFDRAKFPSQFGLGTNGPDDPDMLILGNDYDTKPYYDTMCLDGPDDQYQVASTWVIPPGTDGGPATNGVAVGFDTVVSHDLQKLGTTMLDFPWDIHGALFFERSNCSTAIKRTFEYTAPQALTISSASSTVSVMPSPLDGIYGGDPGDPSLAAGINVGEGTTTLSGGPSGSFVVWLKFAGSGPVIVPTATRPGAAIGWYVPQRVSDREWLIWVQDALQPGEMITVQPN